MKGIITSLLLAANAVLGQEPSYVRPSPTPYPFIIVAPDSARYEQRWQPMLTPEDLRLLIILHTIYGNNAPTNIITINN